MFVLNDYCIEHGLAGVESEHELPYLPHRITIHSPLGEKMLEAAGWTEELAATAMLRRLHA